AVERAVLAGAAMQHVEGFLGLEGLQQGGDVAADVDAGDAIALLFERLGTGASGIDRHLPLGRPAAHQDGDVLCSRHSDSLFASRRASRSANAARRESGDEENRIHAGCATPIRLISHSRSMPEVSFTRARTVSPSDSISAADALPRLMRKLQCSWETWASPTLNPRQPAASISCHALAPGGFLKVEPPVRLLTGWVASRASVIASISAAIFCG